MVQNLYIDVTERKQRERQRAKEEQALSNTLVREVHHRIKNNLQSIAGLLQRKMGTHLSLAPLLEAAITQVNAIAIVHGLQGANHEAPIRLVECLQKICSSVAEVCQRQLEVDIDPGDRTLPELEIEKGEAVAIALVLNELILNSIKHSPDGGNMPAVSLRAAGVGACVFIRNVDEVATDFDIVSGNGIGTGLGLVRSLLPEQGSELSYARDAANCIVTRLRLTPPVVAAISRRRRIEHDEASCRRR